MKSVLISLGLTVLSPETVMALHAKIRRFCKDDAGHAVKLIMKLESANFNAFQRKQESLSKVEIPEDLNEYLNAGIQPVVEEDKETVVDILIAA